MVSFWHNTHPLSSISSDMTDLLIPTSGKCNTLQGELLRASNRINYDWFNNGWGCNNWSGAVVFITKQFSSLPFQPESKVITERHQYLTEVHQYSHGEEAPNGNDTHTNHVVTMIQEIVVQAIMQNPTHISNSDDMFNYQEDDYVPHYDEDNDDSF